MRFYGGLSRSSWRLLRDCWGSRGWCCCWSRGWCCCWSRGWCWCWRRGGHALSHAEGWQCARWGWNILRVVFLEILHHPRQQWLRDIAAILNGGKFVDILNAPTHLDPVVEPDEIQAQIQIAHVWVLLAHRRGFHFFDDTLRYLAADRNARPVGRWIVENTTGFLFFCLAQGGITAFATLGQPRPVEVGIVR